ncbi:MAG: acetate kinase, partial [Candidatus Saganbacteria bacterium]|nr:acetate kinase [Candidatus Saganbacteria bacterium]
MIVLALNCGSSSIKYLLYDWDKRIMKTHGIVERIGIPGSAITHEEPGGSKYKIEQECPTHREALELIVTTLTDQRVGALKDLKEISAVGHRVVHGGEKFKRSVLIDEEVIKAIKAVQDLAPLHNPHNITGIEAAKVLMPDIPQVAVFDTAFHHTIPPYAYIYAVPFEWYHMYGVRRYGFHGTSHLYVSRRAAVMLDKSPDEVNLITMHIGNGVSITAVKGGVSVDTSMGLTPLEGAVMGTRCGDIDPAVVMYMMEKEKLSTDRINSILNKESGLLGVSGVSNDMRDL